MSANIHILKASGKLVKYESLIRTEIEETLKKISLLIELPAMDIVVDDNESSTIPEVGVGGMSPNANLLYIHIDPDFNHTDESLVKEIRSTTAHEVNHCARAHGIGYGKTLLEAIVSEGLADHFDIELNGGEPKKWNQAFTADQMEEMLSKARQDFNNDKYNHKKWFFGGDDVPRWTGYTLGFKLVGDYLRKSSKKPSELVQLPATEFIK